MDWPEARCLPSRAVKHIFVGFEDGSKAIRYYDAQKRSVKVSRNFVFTDVEPVKKVEVLVQADGLTIEGEQAITEESNRQEESTVEDMLLQPPKISPVEPKEPNLPTRVLPSRKAAKDIDYAVAGNPDARPAKPRGPRARTDADTSSATSTDEEVPGGLNFAYAAREEDVGEDEITSRTQSVGNENGLQ